MKMQAPIMLQVKGVKARRETGSQVSCTLINGQLRTHKLPGREEWEQITNPSSF